MTLFTLLALFAAAGLIAAAFVPARAGEAPAPPVAAKKPHATPLHGRTLTDDYFWLREKGTPEVEAYLKAENAYAEALLAPTKPMQEKLYQEMLGRIKQTDLSVPYRDGGWWYYSRTEEGKQYPILCRKKGTLEAEENVLLDLNKLAEGHSFLGLGATAVTDDGNLLLFSTDTTGFRQYVLNVKDLRTGEVTQGIAEKTVSAAWAADNRTIFYTTEDPAKRPYRLYRHAVGTKAHDLVYEEKDELFRIGVERTRSRAYLLLGIGSLTTSEVKYLPAGKPDGTWTTVVPRRHERQYDVDHHGDLFYIRVNDTGRNFRLVTAPVSDPSEKGWKEILPHRADVMLSGIDLFEDWYAVYEREGGLPQIGITDLKTGASHRIEFPEPAYTASPSVNAEWKTDRLRYAYQSMVTPSSVYDYEVATRKSHLLKQEEILGGYDASKYVTKRLHATAKDGTKVPITVVHRRDVKLDGRAPMLLGGYGAYGFSVPIMFQSNRLSLLDRGFVLGSAHIRGGGEMGKTWHDAGRMMNKMNTFTDFIAAAEHVVAEKYTSKDRLAIQGGSAGGLLMGAVTNMRPDLFSVVLSAVPFVDVINTMLDASLPLTAQEWEEWGNPNKKEEYEYMVRYCPYSNLEPTAYPTILVRTSYNDSQVMYWEPAKYVAKLRTVKTDSNPLLLVTNMGAGHGGASGRYDRLREIALDYAFLLDRMGIRE